LQLSGSIYKLNDIELILEVADEEEATHTIAHRNSCCMAYTPLIGSTA